VNRPWSESDVAFLTENYSRLGGKGVAQVLGRSHGAVKVKASLLGLRRFQDDISFFTKWTNESAYVIGLWAADGYANVRPGKGVAVSITQKEKEILLKIKELVGRGCLYYIWQNDSHRYTLHSRALYDHLCKVFGQDVSRKSKTLQWPDIPDKYVRHFVRGYCDGDAHVGVSKRNEPQIWVSSGSSTLMDAVLEYVFCMTGIMGGRYMANDGMHLVIYTGIKAVCLASWLYADGDLAMRRKLKAASEIARVNQSRVNSKSVTSKMMSMFPEILSRYRNLVERFAS